MTAERASGSGWASAARDWVRSGMPRPVVVMSPHPPQECLRRLAAVTTTRKTGWLLDARTATLPDPQLHGQVGPSGVRLAEFAAVTTQGKGRCARFDARVDPTPAGGTTLAGPVGPWSAQSAQTNAVGTLVIAALSAGMGVLLVIVGIVTAASGHFSPGVLVGIAIVIIILVVFMAPLRKHPRPADDRRIAALLKTINGVLDATSEFTVPDPVP